MRVERLLRLDYTDPIPRSPTLLLSRLVRPPSTLPTSIRTILVLCPVSDSTLSGPRFPRSRRRRMGNTSNTLLYLSLYKQHLYLLDPLNRDFEQVLHHTIISGVELMFLKNTKNSQKNSMHNTYGTPKPSLQGSRTLSTVGRT